MSPAMLTLVAAVEVYDRAWDGRDMVDSLSSVRLESRYAMSWTRDEKDMAAAARGPEDVGRRVRMPVSTTEVQKVVASHLSAGGYLKRNFGVVSGIKRKMSRGWRRPKTPFRDRVSFVQSRGDNPGRCIWSLVPNAPRKVSGLYAI